MNAQIEPRVTVAKPRLRSECTALVLQGGGALGSYQAGVYEGLCEDGHSPDWVAGISIGAINAALIAGNPPDQRAQRLRTFWERVSSGIQGGATRARRAGARLVQR